MVQRPAMSPKPNTTPNQWTPLAAPTPQRISAAGPRIMFVTQNQGLGTVQNRIPEKRSSVQETCIENTWKLSHQKDSLDFVPQVIFWSHSGRDRKFLPESLDRWVLDLLVNKSGLVTDLVAGDHHQSVWVLFVQSLFAAAGDGCNDASRFITSNSEFSSIVGLFHEKS
ncbi:hypothetical protein OGAPHI_004926 [Ogataea philodendri]|uniref:Uncharacterized protein n=1 Tax=Ogataea philodendri TaxID=1378263 RepID=A0A9P8P1F4_9ASCO|nr:uncharacterized protein OGAPHI_004926 [Ogataea philodendri]KAH3663525.1 hypothetical protein OGAPHI_004926 [Ogataea philodendri]